ncbi:matrixin family metalloprotease [Hyphomicrobium sp.]|uniref:matrixin family metalloprotease n=1 Tax=Hyphomicrobium sp. TaxID=82 RepID=UPI002E37BEFE|nr:matrixin family metalloprotease [Hyphomicrobium sp.]HEX2839759.1 matrixin family metalloprotease [Hyphomicrobium sp.]
MRGLILAGGAALAAMLAGTHVHADDKTAAQQSEFRLLELGGRKVRWALPAGGLPATISYAFLTEPAQFPGARNCDAMLPPEAALRDSRISLPAFKQEVRAAFSVWEQAANIVFKETNSVADAGILIGADAKPRGRAFTNVALREGSESGVDATRHTAAAMGAIRQSLICFNPQQPWKIGFNGDLDVYDVRFTMTHEIGHAIGLDHPSPEGQLMSFRYVEKARGLQPGDIAGAVALYGGRGVGSAPRPADVPFVKAQTETPAGDRAFGLGEKMPDETQR